MTSNAETTTARAANAAGFAAGFMSAVTHAVTAPVRAWRRHLAIRHLEEFDDHLLRDIGVEREEIRSVVRGTPQSRRDIEFPSRTVFATQASAESWARRTMAANGFADAGRD